MSGNRIGFFHGTTAVRPHVGDALVASRLGEPALKRLRGEGDRKGRPYTAVRTTGGVCPMLGGCGPAMARSHRGAALLPPSSRGLALVSVLLIVAVTTALAYEIANRHAFGIAVSRQLLEGSQARQYALGGELYARQLLYADWENEETRAKDTLLEPGWTEVESFEVDDGSIDVQIVDLTSRFNLNSVIGANGAENFARLKRLLGHLDLDPNIADAWLDWIDDDQDVQGFGAEDADYLLRELPYRTADQPAAHVSEWRLAVPVGEREEFARLRGHVATLPTEALSINVNTATGVVLGSVAPNFRLVDAQRLADDRRNFDSIEDVVANYAPLGAGADVLAVGSVFFRVQVKVLAGEFRSELTSILHRDTDTGELTVVSRSFGERFEEPADEATTSVEAGS